MDVAALLLELYGRIPPLARSAAEGLTAEELTRSPRAGANTIGWLVWHLARVQDHHVSELLDTDQLWVAGDRAAQFGLAADPDNIGYGHDADEMAAVQPDGTDVLLAYLTEVQRRTTDMLAGLSATELDRVVDERWDPPVTLGVRLISVADDSLQHVGQAAYVRGLFGH